MLSVDKYFKILLEVSDRIFCFLIGCDVLRRSWKSIINRMWGDGPQPMSFTEKVLTTAIVVIFANLIYHDQWRVVGKIVGAIVTIAVVIAFGRFVYDFFYRRIREERVTMLFVWHVYRVRGVDEISGKKKTLKVIARDEAAAEKDVASRGLNPPYTFTEIDFDEPTERQVDYAEDLGIDVESFMNRNDVSALIGKKKDDDSDPTDGLMTFAYNRNIYFSPFIGEKSLCTLLLNELSPLYKTAFFAYAVYQSMGNERLGNLDESLVRDKIYEFAELNYCDKNYQRSLDTFLGEDLISFDFDCKRRKAYQDAANFLRYMCRIHSTDVTKSVSTKKTSSNENDKLLAEINEDINALKELNANGPILAPEPAPPKELSDEEKWQAYKNMMIVGAVLLLIFFFNI